MQGAQPKTNPAARVRVSLRLKLGLVCALLAVVPLSLVGLALVDVNADTVETTSRELQVSVLQDVANTIDAEFRTAEQGSLAIARALASQEVQDDLRLPLALTIVESNEVIDLAAIYDRDNAYVDAIRETTAPSLEFDSVLAEDLVARATAEGIAFGEPELVAGSPRVAVVVPILAEADPSQVRGFVAAPIDLQPIQDRVEMLASAHFSGQVDALFVVDQRMRTLAHPDPARVDTLESREGSGALAGLDASTLGPELSRSGEYQQDGDSGTWMVGTVVGLERLPWAMVAQVERSHAYASLIKMRRIVGATVAGAIVVALLVGLFFAQRLTEPLQRLTEFAGKLARREFGATVDVQTNDELSVLGAALGGAAHDLEASEAQIRQEIAIRTDLGRYLPGELVEKVVAREQDMGLGGRRMEITVLFADVVAFTPLTEKLTPEQVVLILNEFFTIATEIIFRHGGTVDKFVGDCVMAMWGAPTPTEDHAQRAIEAAEDILSWLEAGNAGWRETYGVEIEVAIGMNTGSAIVGNIGSQTRMEYTAIGDTVNVAARLESIARPNQILATAHTARSAGPDFDLVDLGERPLSGRGEPVHLYEVRL